jgi:hypothetical protein
MGCLIPADGFYEWRKTARPKLPFAIAMKDGRPFIFAGLSRKLERSRIWRMATHLHDYHGRAERARRTDPSPYAGDSSRKTSRRLAGRNGKRELKRFIAPLPCRPDANVGNFSAGKQRGRMMIHRSGNPFIQSQHRRQTIGLNSCASRQVFKAA